MDIKIIKNFDIRGTNTANKVVKEAIDIEADCPWVIPNGSPFFGDYPKGAQQPLTIVYNEAGGELVRDRDYFIEEEFMPLVAVSGRPIMCFIRLSDAILADNKKVFVTYQSVGAYFVIRNGLKELLAQTTKPDQKWNWSQIIQLPKTFPAGHHWHSIKTELGDWFELTAFFVYMTKNISTRDLSNVGEVSPAIKVFFDRLYQLRDENNVRFGLHASNYNNPHVITKAMLDLGLHPNYATGTVADHQDGTSAILLATPEGVQTLVQDTVVDTEASMEVGVMPVSKFGGDSFIPPNISGSFEGLGSLSVSSALCMEKNGIVMMLTSHNDGRNEGLYYSQVTDVYQPNPKITYTAFKYEAPSLASRGFNPTTVISGSNHRVIMVGNEAQNRWFVALTNGTLEAAAHVYVEVNMEPVLAKGKSVLSSYINSDNRMSIHLIADYVVLIISPGINSTDVHIFYRIPATQLTANLDMLDWELLPVTFKDYEGVQYTAVERFQPMRQVLVDGEVKRWGPVNFLQPPLTTNRGGKTFFLNTKKPNDGSAEYLLIIQGNTPNYRTDTDSRTIAAVFGTGYTFNPTTGVFTEVFRTPTWDADFVNTTQVERDQYSRQHYYQFYDAYAQAAGSSGIILNTGEILIATSAGGNNFPAHLTKLKYANRKSAAEVLSKRMDIIFSPLDHQKRITQTVGSPLLSGVFPSSLTFEPDGELYSAQDPATNLRRTYFRKVSGPYAVRPQVTNAMVDNVRSRPLTNDIYTTNMTYYETPIGVSGSAAELTAGGVECGSTSLASMGYSSMGTLHSYPRSAGFIAPAANGMLLSCPRTYSKVLDDNIKRATYKAESFYGIRKELVDKMEALIPPQFTNYNPWSVSFSIFGNEMGGMFKGLNFGLAVISFYEPSRAGTRQMFVLFTPVVEAPNADHPDVHWIKDVTVLDVTAAWASAVSVRVAEQNLRGLSGARSKGGVYVYRDGDKLLFYVMNPYTTNTTSTIYTRQTSRFDVDLPTKKFENVYSYQASGTTPDLCAPIPRVGMSDVILTGGTENSRIRTSQPGAYDYTGGAARLLHKTNDVTGTTDWYIGPTVYPDVVWTLFFQDGIRFMINGTGYVMPAETIDLKEIDPNPASKVFYIYLTLEDQRGKYVITPSKLRHSARCMHIATVTTSATQILTIERLQPFFIGDLELSTTRKGGIIPVSTGLPQNVGEFVFLKQNELLP